MACDPLAACASSHLEPRTYTLEPHGSPEITPKLLDALVSENAAAMTVVGQEQLNTFLTSLDAAPAKLLAAIKQPTEMPTGSPTVTTSGIEPGQLC